MSSAAPDVLDACEAEVADLLASLAEGDTLRASLASIKFRILDEFRDTEPLARLPRERVTEAHARQVVALHSGFSSWAALKDGVYRGPPATFCTPCLQPERAPAIPPRTRRRAEQAFSDWHVNLAAVERLCGESGADGARAILEQIKATERLPYNAALAAGAVTRRFLRDADAAGAVWSRDLDHIATLQIWPRPSLREYDLVGHAAYARFPSARARADLLEPFIRRGEWQALSGCAAVEVWSSIASETPFIDDELVDAVCGDPRLLASVGGTLLHRGQLTDQHLSDVKEAAIEYLTAPRPTAPTAPAPRRGRRRSRFDGPEFQQHHDRFEIERLLAKIVGDRLPLTPDEIARFEHELAQRRWHLPVLIANPTMPDRILRLIADACDSLSYGDLMELVWHPRASTSTRVRFLDTGRRSGIEWVLTTLRRPATPAHSTRAEDAPDAPHRCSPADVITAVLQAQHCSPRLAAETLRAASATLAHCRAALTRFPHPDVRAAAARVPGALADAAVKAEVLRSRRSPAVADALATISTEPADFMDAFRELARKDPRAALRALGSAPEGVMLTPGDVAALFEREGLQEKLDGSSHN